MRVIHRDVQIRHVIGPQEDLSRWRIIDFDGAREYAEDESFEEAFREEVREERIMVGIRLKVSAALWSLEPGALIGTGCDDCTVSSSEENEIMEEVEAAL